MTAAGIRPDVTQDGPELLRIPFSTFCRKTEWGLTQAGIAYSALDVTILGMRRIRRANPWERTVPILVVDGRTIPGSHRILAWADGRRAPGRPSLFPTETHGEVVAWEKWADDELGPLLRREVYRVLHRRVRDYARSPWDAVRLWAMKPGFRIAARFYKATSDDPADRRAAHEALAFTVTKLRAGGTGYLFGRHATAADVATAAFWEPVLPIGARTGLAGDDGWEDVVAYVNRVKPKATSRTQARPIRSKDWDRLEQAAKATGPPIA